MPSAHRVTLRNFPQREGYENLEAVPVERYSTKEGRRSGAARDLDHEGNHGERTERYFPIVPFASQWSEPKDNFHSARRPKGNSHAKFRLPPKMKELPGRMYFYGNTPLRHRCMGRSIQPYPSVLYLQSPLYEPTDRLGKDPMFLFQYALGE
uniref:Uncharacterized protein n=1 Tax=Candidatus Kentrum sp. TC TaxID=2126339 RepID=A0A450YVX7_9GAMM|nr:MAG: hypothetical protein BECKTC1821D_GA0114238_102614 [Candidatus Kentron sp. TC]